MFIHTENDTESHRSTQKHQCIDQITPQTRKFISISTITIFSKIHKKNRGSNTASFYVAFYGIIYTVEGHTA